MDFWTGHSVVWHSLIVVMLLTGLPASAQQGSSEGQKAAMEAARMEAEKMKAANMEAEKMEADEMEEGQSEDEAYQSTSGEADLGSSTLKTYLGNLVPLTRGFKMTSLLDTSKEVSIDSGPVLSREAEQAFGSGDQGLANSLMYGHMVTEYAEANVPIQSVKFSTLLKQPVWNLRFGISIAVRGDSILGASPIRAGGRSGSSEREDFDGGDVMMKAKMKMVSSKATEKLDSKLGLVAEVLAEKFNERYSRGDFGAILNSVSPPDKLDVSMEESDDSIPLEASMSEKSFMSEKSSMSEGLRDAMAEAAAPLPMWQPGIGYLGEGSWQELLPYAKSKHVDLILHLDVVLKAGRDDNVQNISRCRLINVATGKSLCVSKAMDSIEADRLASSGRSDERDYVEEQLATFLLIMDRDVVLKDMPAISKAAAHRRISSLIAANSIRKLRSLAEIRYYQIQKLITEEDVEAAFGIIGGVDGLMFLHGPRDERIQAARKMAVKSQGTDAES